MRRFSLPRSPFQALSERKGVAALEFAMIAPVMILMFYGMVELGQGLIAERRVSHATVALGDLAAQNSTISHSDANDMFSAASDIMTPLTTTPLQMRLSAFVGDKNGSPKATWSYVSSGSSMTAYAANATPDSPIPNGLIVNQGDSVVVSESKYAYTSPVGYVLPNGINFSRTAFLRPRNGSVNSTD